MAEERISSGFGSKLREARERRGATLQDVSRTTKISTAVLEAIERNDVSKLPGGVFSRGFVKAYAIQIGLDPDAIVKEFIDQFPDASRSASLSTAVEIEDNAALESNRRIASAVLWLAMISGAVASVVLYFGWMGRPEPSRQAGESQVVAGAATAPGSVADTPSNEPAIARTNPVDTTAGAEPTAGVVPAADRLSVDLVATGRCWVRAIVDGRLELERLLQPGEREQMEVRRELVLTAGDAGALTVMLNGVNAKPLGGSGEVVRTRYDLTNFRDRLADR